MSQILGLNLERAFFYILSVQVDYQEAEGWKKEGIINRF